MYLVYTIVCDFWMSVEMFACWYIKFHILQISLRHIVSYVGYI